MQKSIKLYIDSGNTDILNSILSFVTHTKREPILDYLDIFVKKLKKINKINTRILEQEILNNDNDNILNPQKYIITILNKS